MNTQIEEKQSDFLLFHEGSLYEVQSDGNKIIEYAMKTGEIFCYDINEGRKGWGNFSCVTVNRGWLYVFPRYDSGHIVKIDLQNKEVYKIDVPGVIRAASCGKGEVLWKKGYPIGDKHVILFAADRRDICIYNLLTDAYQIVYVPEIVQGITDICETEKGLYILDCQNAIYEWDYVHNKLVLFSKVERKYEPFYFGKLINTDEKLVLLPACGEDIYFCDKNSKLCSVYQDYPKHFEYFGPEEWAKYVNECQSGDSIYFPMRKSQYILQIDRKTGFLEWIKPVQFSKKEKIEYYVHRKEKFYVEGDVHLDEYLCMMKEGRI